MTKHSNNTKDTLLKSAIEILLKAGIQGFTLQAVAENAQISKGGLLHYFPNKRALILGIYQDIIERFEAKLDQLIQEDEIDYGSFTRAYLKTILLDTKTGMHSQLATLYIALSNDPELSILWEKWFNAQQEKHAKTDNDDQLHIIRLAADGIWFNHNLGSQPKLKNSALIERMIQQTYPSAQN